MGYLFVVAEGLVDLAITAIDGNLLKAEGHVWHKSSMEREEKVHRPDIDTGARWWGDSHTNKGWVFGYKLHLTSTTMGEIVVLLTAVDVTTTANMPDNKMYVTLTSYSSSVFSLPSLHYMTADPGYDDKKLYEYSKKTLGMDLVCPE